MNRFARLALVAVGAIALIVFGIRFLIGGPLIGSGPSPSPTIAPTPTRAPTATGAPDGTAAANPSASPIVLSRLAETQTLAAGTYVLRPFAPPNDSISFTFTVPDGWQSFGAAFLPTTGNEGPDGMQFGFTRVTSLESDPCHYSSSEPVPVGSTVGELEAAFRNQTAYTVSDLGVGRLGDVEARRLDLQLPTDLDYSTCDEGQFWVFRDAEGMYPYQQGVGQRIHLWIIDANGTPVIFSTWDFAGTSEADRAELAAIAASVRLDPEQTTTGAASPIALPDPGQPLKPLAAGTYSAHPFAEHADTTRFVFTIPAGWQGDAFGVSPVGGDQFGPPAGMALVFNRPVALHTEPCDWLDDRRLSLGPTVDGFLKGLNELKRYGPPGYSWSTPTAVTLAGHQARRLDIKLPTHIDFATCDEGAYRIWDSYGGDIYAQGPGNIWHLTVLDVDGKLVNVMVEDFPATSAADRATMQTIIDSIQINL